MKASKFSDAAAQRVKGDIGCARKTEEWHTNEQILSGSEEC